MILKEATVETIVVLEWAGLVRCVSGKTGEPA